jgi:hypothetical protein
MQRITQRAFHPAAVHAVVGLGVPDGRLDGLATLEQAPSAAVDNCSTGPNDPLSVYLLG